MQSSDQLASVIVVGGGIVGRTTALRLREAGHDVLLIDPDSPSRPASFGNAGHIAVEQVRPLTNPAYLRSVPRRLFVFGGPLDVGWRRPGLWFPWTLRALRACGHSANGERALGAILAHALPAWQRLAHDLGRPDLLIEGGHLLLWHDPARGAAGAAGWRDGPTGTASVVLLPDDALSELSPPLARAPTAGLRVHGTAQLSDVGSAMQALLARFEALGGRCERAGVARLLVTGVVLVDGRTLLADRLVVAAGVGSRALLRTLGVTMPLIAERGYHLEWSHGGAYDLPPLVFEERSLIATRFGDKLRASSFVEFTAEHAPPDPRKWRRLERHVRALGLPVASAFTRWVGARPTLPDYLPAIGPLPTAPSVIVACGHQHLGLTLAPVTAEVVAVLVAGRASPVELTAFRPGRFGKAKKYAPGARLRQSPENPIVEGADRRGSGLDGLSCATDRGIAHSPPLGSLP